MLDRLLDRVRPPLQARIVYLHVPKCGGTSIRQAMASCFKPWRSTQRDSVLQLREEAARTAAASGRIDYGESRRALLAYHLATTRARLVAGHYRYSRLAFERHRGHWSFVTMLRHPVDRWYSNYFFNASRPRDDLYHIALPLDEFVETERAGVFGTGLVRSFADIDEPDDAASKWAIDRAITHLREFHLVGTLEDLPSFCRAFMDCFGCPLDVPRLNVAPRGEGDPRATVAPTVAERVRQVCEPDLTLFRSFFPDDTGVHIGSRLESRDQP